MLQQQDSSPSSPPLSTSLWCAAVPVLVLAVLYRDIGGVGLWADDYELVQLAAEGPWRLSSYLPWNYADSGIPYWRPATAGLYELAYSLFGWWEAGYVWVGVMLQTAAAVLLAVWAHRVTGSMMAGVVASVWFATSAAHQEAVLWPAGSFNALPSGIALIVIAMLLHSPRLGPVSRAAWVVAVSLLSLTMREAAYVVPLLAGAAPVVMRRSRAELYWSWGAAAVVFLSCAAHYKLLNRVDAGAGGLLGRVTQPVYWIGRTMLDVFPVLDPLGESVPTIALASTAFAVWIVILAVAYSVVGPKQRFFVVWTAVGLFPYCLVDMGARHQWFQHPGLAMLIGCAMGVRAFWFRSIALALAISVIGVNAFYRVPDRIMVFEDFTAICRHVNESMRDVLDSRLEAGQEVTGFAVSMVHPAANNTLLAIGRRYLQTEEEIGLLDLAAVGPPRGLFQPCLQPVPPAEPGLLFLHWDAAGVRYVDVPRHRTFGEVGGLPIVGLPIAQFATGVSVVADERAADLATATEYRDVPGQRTAHVVRKHEERLPTADRSISEGAFMPAGGPVRGQASSEVVLPVQCDGYAVLLVCPPVGLPTAQLLDRVTVDGKPAERAVLCGSTTVGVVLDVGEYRIGIPIR